MEKSNSNGSSGGGLSNLEDISEALEDEITAGAKQKPSTTGQNGATANGRITHQVKQEQTVYCWLYQKIVEDLLVVWLN